MRLPRILLAMLATIALVVGFMPTAHADDTTATLGSGQQRRVLGEGAHEVLTHRSLTRTP